MSSTTHSLRPCKTCATYPKFRYHMWKAAPPVIELICPTCETGTHSYSEATTCATWNALNLPEEKS